MPDTSDEPQGVATDTKSRLAPAVITRLHELGADNNDKAAVVLGVSRSTFYRLRRGATSPRLKDVEAIANRIGLPIDAVFEAA